MNIKTLSAALAAAAIVTLPLASMAGSLSANQTSVPVSATVVKDCIVGTPPGGMDFGNIDIVKGTNPQNSAPTSTVTFSCNNGTTWTLMADKTGSSPAAFPYTAGSLTCSACSTSTPLSYSVAAATASASSSSSTTPITNVLTGTLGSGQDPTIGSYADSFVVTVSF